MLVESRVTQALESQREAFRQGLSRTVHARQLYVEALDQLASLSSGEIAERLGGVPWPGARPTGELDEHGLIVPFETQWAHAQEARAWALDRLRGVTTVGVDGSQIAASREFAVPVSLIQVAWFENPHEPDRQYVKDVRDELLFPDESLEEGGDFPFGDSTLNLRRFVLETDVVRENIERLAARDGEIDRKEESGTVAEGGAGRKSYPEGTLYPVRSPRRTVPVVLFDGSLVLSFAGRMSPATRDSYLQAVFSILEASARNRVPLAGYVDLSLASDLTAMVRTACDLDQRATPGFHFDAALLGPRMKAFDRTAVFQCARGGIMPHYRTQESDYSHDLYFIYLKAGRDRLPSRIDFPRWVFEAGLVDHMVDILRAEIVVGSGYPYALETADATAVLSTEDRFGFYRLWQQFATSEGVENAVPAKQASKLRRR